MLEEVAVAIGSTLLLNLSELEGKDSMEINDVFDLIESQRTSLLDGLLAKYRTVRPIMMQLEGVVAGSATGTSPVLAEFYRYWECRFFNSITQMILASMVAFQALLNVGLTLPPEAAPPPTRPPLIRVKATFAAPDVVLSPDLTHLSKYLRRAVNQVSSSRIMQ